MSELSVTAIEQSGHDAVGIIVNARQRLLANPWADMFLEHVESRIRAQLNWEMYEYFRDPNPPLIDLPF